MLTTTWLGAHRLVEQPQQHHLLLEGLEHRPDRREVEGVLGQVGRPAQHYPVAVLLHEGLEQHGASASSAGRAARARPSPAARSRPRQRPAGGDRAAAHSGSSAGRPPSRPNRPGNSTTRCSTRPVSVISTSISRVRDSATSSTWRIRLRDSDGYCTTATLRVSWARVRTARWSTSSRSTASSRKVWMARRSATESGFSSVEPVDEEPVPGVGGHPTSARVRLRDQAFLLERRHVVADRRRRDAEIVPVDERLAAHRLVRSDEVLDDGAQNLELALLDVHRIGRPFVRCATAYSTDRRRGIDGRAG